MTAYGGLLLRICGSEELLHSHLNLISPNDLEWARCVSVCIASLALTGLGAKPPFPIEATTTHGFETLSVSLYIPGWHNVTTHLARSHQLSGLECRPHVRDAALACSGCLNDRAQSCLILICDGLEYTKPTPLRQKRAWKRCTQLLCGCLRPRRHEHRIRGCEPRNQPGFDPSFHSFHRVELQRVEDCILTRPPLECLFGGRWRCVAENDLSFTAIQRPLTLASPYRRKNQWTLRLKGGGLQAEQELTSRRFSEDE